MRTRHNIKTFWSRAKPVGECLAWTGTIDEAGYGRYSGRIAHRLAYEFAVGPIPEGLTIDHLCRNRSCVEPSHLEPVTQGENCRRQPPRSHCPHGHPFSGRNLYVDTRGVKRCRACNIEHQRRFKAKRAKVS